MLTRGCTGLLAVMSEFSAKGYSFSILVSEGCPNRVGTGTSKAPLDGGQGSYKGPLWGQNMYKSLDPHWVAVKELRLRYPIWYT